MLLKHAKKPRGFLLHLLYVGVIARFIEYIKNPDDESTGEKDSS